MARSTFLLPLAALALAPFAGAQQFTYNAAALPAQSLWTDGVAIADIDNDGDNDILFANGSAYGGTGSTGALAQHLFLNNGSGSFVAAHANLNVAAFNAKMVIAEDFDNDGDLDLFYASGSTGSPPRLLINLGGIQAGTVGFFNDVTATNVPALALRSFSICAGDTDNDGDLDVVVTDGGTFGGTPSQALLLENDGSAVFTNVTAAKMPVDLYNAQDVTLLDFDGDFDVDIALSGKGATGKRGRLYLNNGAGVFSINTVMDAIGTSATYEVDWADLDGDNDFDSAVQSVSGQSEGWARNVGTGSPMTTTVFPLPNGNDDNEMALFDYDNDGDLDVFVASLGATEKAYRNDGGVFVNVNSIIQAQSDSTLDFAFGDLNGDGMYDMVTAQGESGNFTNKVYFNNGPGNDQLAKVLAVESTPITSPTTAVHIQLSDVFSDDGTNDLHGTYEWKTSINTVGGSGTAFHMGNGLFRMPIPTPDTFVPTWYYVQWHYTQHWGETIWGSNSGGLLPNSFTALAFALPGVSGDPVLSGTGSLLPLTAATISLSNANPSSSALLFVSLSSSPVPFKGGQMAAFPFFSTVALATSGTGTIPIPFTVPMGVPSGVSIFLQYAIQDAAAVQGVALSNLLQGTFL
jgi:hypothetical protein